MQQNYFKVHLRGYVDLVPPLCLKDATTLPVLQMCDSDRNIRGGLANYKLPRGFLRNLTISGNMSAAVQVQVDCDDWYWDPNQWHGCNVTFNTVTRSGIKTRQWTHLGSTRVPNRSQSPIAISIGQISPRCRISQMRVVRDNISTPAAAGQLSSNPCWRAHRIAVQAVCERKYCAYITLVPNDSLVELALKLHHSLRKHNTMKLVVLCSSKVSTAGMKALSGRYKLMAMKMNQNTHMTKLEAWRLMEYRKLIWMDADTRVVGFTDSLFTCPAGAAAADDTAPGFFNSGIFVFKPSLTVYDNLKHFDELKHLDALTLVGRSSVSDNDEAKWGFLDKEFPDWPHHAELHLPPRSNYILKRRNLAALHQDSCKVSRQMNNVTLACSKKVLGKERHGDNHARRFISNKHRANNKLAFLAWTRTLNKNPVRPA
mmetsp:Transcript_74052/g.123674  ORF Transcript_74052/g.123674 Transcript_74052/m.123674 type:complete len:428 (-) Transcript_74052:156-1439(-)|eukprot:CAMPEP_0119335186 /NCGR_PEP_ID=MMETSP1333-20130426/88941_1 /TAXON_ID=418940 /ORGANISM="Scyphosphaera apsteinii, Strain RCC1455" /LENGTH=427 /DNA_ID=CAMNT_0007345669 /DNA_START=86 /DNA_END=1369 /DNA_ORIENTATION=-